MDWLVSNAGTLLTLAAVILIVFFALRSKLRIGGSCGCGCSQCACGCREKQKKGRKSHEAD